MAVCYCNADTREIKICVRALRNEITDFIIKYNTTHPNISFRTIFDFTGTSAEDFDIIVDDKPLLYAEYEKFELSSKRVRLKAAANSPLCGKELCLKQLCKQPFISFGEHSSTHKMLLSACQREGFTPNFVVQTNDLLCYNKYVEAGIGIGVERYDKENKRKQAVKKHNFLMLLILESDKQYMCFINYIQHMVTFRKFLRRVRNMC